jgi:hypothetical protein
MGRFLSQDTWGVNYSNPVELNRYVYTAGNPINHSDPSGLFALTEYGTTVSQKPKEAAPLGYVATSFAEGLASAGNLSLYTLPAGEFAAFVASLPLLVRVFLIGVFLTPVIGPVVCATCYAPPQVEAQPQPVSQSQTQTQPQPQPEQPEYPSPELTEESNSEPEFIYREGPDKAKRVRLYREVDWKTGLSFSTFQFPPPNGSIIYSVDKLRANGYIVNFDGSQPTLDLPFFGGGQHFGIPVTLPVGHVTVYYNDESYWTQWYYDEQLNTNTPNVTPQTLAFYALSER